MNSLILPRLYISCLHLYLSYTWFIINMFEIYYCKKSANIASRLNERNFIRFSNFLLLTLNDALQCSLHRCDSSNNYYFHTLPQEILRWRCTERPYFTIKIKISFSQSELKRSVVQNIQMQEIFKQLLLLLLKILILYNGICYICQTKLKTFQRN